MRLITKEVKELQKGCKKQMWKKSYVIKDYKGKDTAHFKCGNGFPKGWTDKRHNLKKYPKILCFDCRNKIKIKINQIELIKLKEFYKLKHTKGIKK